MIIVNCALVLLQKYTANEGPVRIRYQCMFLIYVLPEKNLHASLFPKENYNVLTPKFHIHVSVSDLCIPKIGLPILQQPNRLTDSVAHEQCFHLL
jgi:hypothetical protein